MAAIRIIFMVVAIAASTPGLALEPDVLFAKVSPSIVVVWGLNSDGDKNSQGSGVVVSPGDVVTNCHVIEDAHSIFVEQRNRTSKARLRYVDANRDLCQLKLEIPLGSPIARMVPFHRLRVGQRVYTLGAPKGLSLSFGEGLVSQLRSEGDFQVIQTTAPISPGSSGGGLFDDDGRLIGITTFVMSGQNLNFAVPANWVSELGIRHTQEENRRRLAEEKRNEEDAQRRAEAELKFLQQEREREAAETLWQAERNRLEEQRRAEELNRTPERKELAAAMERERVQKEAARKQREADEAKIRSEAERRAAHNKLIETHMARIRAKVLPRIRVPDDMKGNPEGMFEVTVLPGGDVLEARLVRSSGVSAYDLAVERAIIGASPLPVPGDSDLFQQEFRKFKFSFKSDF